MQKAFSKNHFDCGLSYYCVGVDKGTNSPKRFHFRKMFLGITLSHPFSEWPLVCFHMAVL